jgi:hypothetical protein
VHRNVNHRHWRGHSVPFGGVTSSAVSALSGTIAPTETRGWIARFLSGRSSTHRNPSTSHEQNSQKRNCRQQARNNHAHAIILHFQCYPVGWGGRVWHPHVQRPAALVNEPLARRIEKLQLAGKPIPAARSICLGGPRAGTQPPFGGVTSSGCDAIIGANCKEAEPPRGVDVVVRRPYPAYCSTRGADDARIPPTVVHGVQTTPVSRLL